MYQPSRSRRVTKPKTTSPELRHVVVHDYHDHSMDRPTLVQSDDEVDDQKKRSGPRGGVNVPFPTKLHVMLSRVEDDGLAHIVGWYVLSPTYFFYVRAFRSNMLRGFSTYHIYEGNLTDVAL